MNLFTITTATINMHDKYQLGESGWRTYLNDRIASLRETRKSTPTGIIIIETPGVECPLSRRDEISDLFEEVVKNHQMPAPASP